MMEKYGEDERKVRIEDGQFYDENIGEIVDRPRFDCESVPSFIGNPYIKTNLILSPCIELELLQIGSRGKPVRTIGFTYNGDFFLFRSIVEDSVGGRLGELDGFIKELVGNDQRSTRKAYSTSKIEELPPEYREIFQPQLLRVVEELTPGIVAYGKSVRNKTVRELMRRLEAKYQIDFSDFNFSKKPFSYPKK